MEITGNTAEELNKMFLQNEEQDSLGTLMDMVGSGYQDSSSPEVAAKFGYQDSSSPEEVAPLAGSKNIVCWATLTGMVGSGYHDSSSPEVAAKFGYHDLSSPEEVAPLAGSKNIVCCGALTGMVGSGYHDLSSPEGAAKFVYHDSSSPEDAAPLAASKNIVCWGALTGKVGSGYHDSSSPEGAAKFGYHDSSSPEDAAPLAASKNIISERNRRKKLEDKLLALRQAVPKISKMDKASIIKDAIDYIQELQEQERRLEAEIRELEPKKLKRNSGYVFDQELPALLPSKKKRIDQSYGSRGYCRTSPIEGLELGFDYMGETLVVRLKCIKRTETMVKLCELFETLQLKIITANIATVSGRLLKTVFIEADEEERDYLKKRIEAAIAALNDPQSTMSM